MSDRLSDAELALSRLRDFCGQHGWDGEPALSALRPLLDEVREYRQRIAELEDALESERRSGAVAAENSTVEHHRKRAMMFADRIDAREAQLAEMVKKIQDGINWMTETVSCEWLAECFKECGIPITSPEAEEDSDG